MTQIEKMDYLKNIGFTYNPDTGEIVSADNNVRRGKCSRGYIYLTFRIGKKHYTVSGHRFAWFMVYGSLPKKQIDHINRDKSDNRIENLRDISQAENRYNLSNVRGYYYNQQRGLYISYITKNKKTIMLGKYTNEQDARQAYLNAKKIYHVIC
jgi:hypothetical protein